MKKDVKKTPLRNFIKTIIKDALLLDILEKGTENLNFSLNLKLNSNQINSTIVCKLLEKKELFSYQMLFVLDAFAKSIFSFINVSSNLGNKDKTTPFFYLDNKIIDELKEIIVNNIMYMTPEEREISTKGFKELLTLISLIDTLNLKQKDFISQAGITINEPSFSSVKKHKENKTNYHQELYKLKKFISKSDKLLDFLYLLTLDDVLDEIINQNILLNEFIIKKESDEKLLVSLTSLSLFMATNSIEKTKYFLFENGNSQNNILPFFSSTRTFQSWLTIKEIEKLKKNNKIFIPNSKQFFSFSDFFTMYNIKKLYNSMGITNTESIENIEERETQIHDREIYLFAQSEEFKKDFDEIVRKSIDIQDKEIAFLTKFEQKDMKRYLDEDLSIKTRALVLFSIFEVELDEYISALNNESQRVIDDILLEEYHQVAIKKKKNVFFTNENKHYIFLLVSYILEDMVKKHHHLKPVISKQYENHFISLVKTAKEKMVNTLLQYALDKYFDYFNDIQEKNPPISQNTDTESIEKETTENTEESKSSSVITDDSDDTASATPPPPKDKNTPPTTFSNNNKNEEVSYEDDNDNNDNDNDEEDRKLDTIIHLNNLEV